LFSISSAEMVRELGRQSVLMSIFVQAFISSVGTISALNKSAYFKI
jgi:hypothetical protein